MEAACRPEAMIMAPRKGLVINAITPRSAVILVNRVVSLMTSLARAQADDQLDAVIDLALARTTSPSSQSLSA